MGSSTIAAECVTTTESIRTDGEAKYLPTSEAPVRTHAEAPVRGGQSLRSALLGSKRAARQAGTQHARIATVATAAIVPVITSGS